MRIVGLSATIHRVSSIPTGAVFCLTKSCFGEEKIRGRGCGVEGEGDAASPNLLAFPPRGEAFPILSGGGARRCLAHSGVYFAGSPKTSYYLLKNKQRLQTRPPVFTIPCPPNQGDILLLLSGVAHIEYLDEALARDSNLSHWCQGPKSQTLRHVDTFRSSVGMILADPLSPERSQALSSRVS